MDFGNLFQQVKDNLQFLLVCLLTVAAIVALVKVSEKTILKESVAKVSGTKYTAICGMLGALAAVLMALDFPVPFLAPPFYKMDLSEIPVLIGGFCLGPVASVVIELIKVLLETIIKGGSTTAFVGEFANFVVGCTLVAPASILYHLKKTRKTAILSLACGTAVMAVFGTAFNAVYLLPAFSSLFGMPLDQIIAMGTAINGNIHSVTTFVIFAVFPLNVIKGTLVSVLTVLLYKRISVFLHNMIAGDAAQNRRIKVKRS
ncbi:MAG: ECF transporter S component [Lachnospiraceae bacterium]|nr:ECF transporter S component [Lachnospiraceae bacterium]